MNLEFESRTGAAAHFLLIAAILGVVAALAPVPPFTDRLVFEAVGRHPFTRGCADLNCFRVVVPWITAQIPFDSMTRMKLFAVVCQAAAAVAVGRLSPLLGLSPRSARLAMWLSALGAGSFASLANPYSADPLIFLLSPVVLLLLLRDQIGLAAVVSGFGIFAKEFAAVPLWLFTAYAWMASRRDVRARSLGAAMAVTAAWLALQIVLIVFLQFSYGGNPSSRLFAGGYARVWLHELGMRKAAVALFTTFGPLYLLMPSALATCARPLRLLAVAAVPAALAFAYVETPERALWNFFFLAIPLAALTLERLPEFWAWAFVVTFALANLRIGAQIMIVPASRYALLASSALAVAAIATRHRAPLAGVSRIS
jgi:hypothetical protein